MNNPLIYRQNKLFKIDIKQLPIKARTTEKINALYAAIYFEFRGAEENDKYKKYTYQERMEKLNQFAKDWLLKQGFK